jgi:membrane associated rhomboid family serine protease
MTIWEDFKYNITKGARLHQILLINLSVFVVILMARIILRMTGESSGVAFQQLIDWLALSADPGYIIRHPWILVSHMFLHIGVWHLIWNLLTLYWFGNMVGDLLGDARIWPLYLFSGACGAGIILFFTIVFQWPAAQIQAYGASAAVMGFVAGAAFIAPDYIMHLFIIGPVRLKYIALFVLLLDLVGIAENNNSGGHLGHLGGAIGGVLFILGLRNGWFEWMSRPAPKEKGKIIPIKKSIKSLAEGNTDRGYNTSERSSGLPSNQQEVDRILDKIRAKGLQSLTKEEKEILDQAGKES